MTVKNKEKCTELVAVYGTLRKGGQFNKSTIEPAIKKGEAEFLTTMETTPKFRMYAVPAAFFPAVVEGDSIIKIELYKVTPKILKRLDAIEGYFGEESKTNLYNRQQIETAYGKAYIYIYGKKVTNKYELVESGDWTEFVNKA